MMGIYIGTERDDHGVDYAIFNPYVVYLPNERAVVSSSINGKLMMPLFSLKALGGTLEEWVAKYNETKERKEKILNQR
jgi:hypothetical protein